MARSLVNNQKGQTAVEYIFMIAVVVTIITSLLSVIKNKYLGDLSNCQGANSQKFLCKINVLLMADEAQPRRFMYYRFRK